MVGWLLAKRNKKGINLEELLAGLLTVGLVVMMMMTMMPSGKMMMQFSVSMIILNSVQGRGPFE